MTRLRQSLATLAATAGQVLFALGLASTFALRASVDKPVVEERPRQTVFRSQADAVLLDVLATDRAGAISNLRATDFEVRDNGVVQTLTHVSGEVAPLAVFLLLDTSGSLTVRDLDHLRRAAADVAKTLREGDELRLLTFSHLITWHGRVDTGSLGPIFSRLEPLGETALHDALTIGLRLSDRQDTKRPVVIAFSDGADTASWTTATQVDEAARQSWAAFFGATPRAAAVPIFGDLAALTGGATLTLNADVASLPETFLQILERVRQRYLVAFTPSSNAPGWHELEVRVKRSGARVVARRGYLRR
jgi:Mg-chelatase subunit ChlD